MLDLLPGDMEGLLVDMSFANIKRLLLGLLLVLNLEAPPENQAQVEEIPRFHPSKQEVELLESERLEQV